MMFTWESHDMESIVSAVTNNHSHMMFISHMMFTCSYEGHMTWHPLYLQDLVEFKEQHNVSLTTHSDESEILTHSQLHSTLSSALGELMDPTCWTHSWVTRYSSVVRLRGIVAHKGYVHKWSFKQLLLLPVSFWYCKSGKLIMATIILSLTYYKCTILQKVTRYSHDMKISVNSVSAQDTLANARPYQLHCMIP